LLDRAPPRPAGADLAAEPEKRLVVGWLRDQRHRDPGGGRDGDAGDQLLPLGELRPAEARVDQLEEDGGQKGDGHGRDLAEGVHPPPEPAQQEQEPGAGADLQHQVKGRFGAFEKRGEQARHHHERQRGDPADQHQPLLGGRGVDEALVEIVHEVRRAPVQMGREGREERAQQRRHHDAHQACRQEGQHGRIGQVVAHHLGVHVGEGRAQRVEVGVDQQRAERDDVPGPGAQPVVDGVEQQRRADRVHFVLGREHALRDIPAAAGLRAGVPDVPPLDSNGDDEHGDQQVGVREVGKEAELLDNGRVGHEAGETVDLGQSDGVDRRRHRADQDDCELEKVGDHDAAHAAQSAVEHGHHGGDGDDLDWRKIEHHDADLDRAEDDQSGDDGVEEHAQVERPEPAQDRGGLAAVAQLIELDVGLGPRAVPELRVDEDGEHARQQESPPDPVAGDAVLADDFREEVRGVGRGRGGAHRDAQHPPRHRVAGQEKLGRAFAGLLRGDESDDDQDDEEQGDDDPVDRLQYHGVFLTQSHFHSNRTSPKNSGQ
jgi:hypothetical protein